MRARIRRRKPEFTVNFTVLVCIQKFHISMALAWSLMRGGDIMDVILGLSGKIVDLRVSSQIAKARAARGRFCDW